MLRFIQNFIIEIYRTTKSNIIKGIIAALLIIFLIKKFNILSILKYTQFDWTYLFFSILFYSAALMILSLRWRYIIQRTIRITPTNVYVTKAFIGSLFISDFTPARIGDFSRATMLNKDYKVPLLDGTFSVFIDKLNDAIMISFLSLFGLVIVYTSLKDIALSVLLFIILFFVIALLMILKPDIPVYFIKKIFKSDKKAWSMTNKDSIRTLTMTGIAWVFQSLFVYYIFLSLGVNVKFLPLLGILPFIRLSVLIPFTIAGLGIVEWVGTFVYSEVFGVSLSISATVTLLERIITIIVHIMGLLVYTFRRDSCR